MIKIFLVSISVLFVTGVSVAQPLSLDQVRMQFHGADPLHPSPESLLGRYIRETGAQTIIRTFLKEPPSVQTPRPRSGPSRLVVTVSARTFPVFLRYFSSSNFLFSLGEHGNKVAFKGRRSGYGAIFETNVLTHPFICPGACRGIRPAPTWDGLLLDSEFAIPILLNSEEGDQAERYFALTAIDSEYGRFPWQLTGPEGPYCSTSAFAGSCASWLGMMPIGSELVDRYTFASGDVLGQNPRQDPLRSYVLPQSVPAETARLMYSVWTNPGHKQLGEIIDPGANRRAEFENTGWVTYTLLGSAGVDRVPVMFLFVENERQPLRAGFSFVIEPTM